MFTENILFVRHNIRHWRCKNHEFLSDVILIFHFCFLQTILYIAARMIFLKQLIENVTPLLRLHNLAYTGWNLKFLAWNNYSTPFTLEPWTISHSLNISQILQLPSLCSCSFICILITCWKPIYSTGCSSTVSSSHW